MAPGVSSCGDHPENWLAPTKVPVGEGLDPLPPVPGEPLYEELKNPEQLPLDEEQYLEPNPVKIASVESLDEEGYLKPNFHRVQPFNTRSPTRESPEPIPMVSYSSQDELERDKV